MILGFDVDACQVAYDGGRVLATPAAAQALQPKINIPDPERSSADYETSAPSLLDQLRLCCRCARSRPGPCRNQAPSRLLRPPHKDSLQLRRILDTTSSKASFKMSDRTIAGLSKLLVYSRLRFQIEEDTYLDDDGLIQPRPPPPEEEWPQFGPDYLLNLRSLEEGYLG